MSAKPAPFVRLDIPLDQQGVDIDDADDESNMSSRSPSRQAPRAQRRARVRTHYVPAAKGSEGTVLSADIATNKVTVEGVNVSPKKTRDPRTGKVTATMIAKPIDASNVKKI